MWHAQLAMKLDDASDRTEMVDMSKHKDPEKNDDKEFHETLRSLPVYPCLHTGTTIVNGKTVCAGCGKAM